MQPCIHQTAHALLTLAHLRTTTPIAIACQIATRALADAPLNPVRKYVAAAHPPTPPKGLNKPTGGTTHPHQMPAVALWPD